MAVVIRHLYDNFESSPAGSRPCSRQYDSCDLSKYDAKSARRGISDLPVEVLYQIVNTCAEEPLVYTRLKVFRALRQTCKLLNLIVTPYVYEQAAFSGPHAFARFLRELKDHPNRGRWVRNLDFSAFTSIGLGRSRFTNGQYTLLTAESLAECLLLCPNVEELFMSESLQTDIDQEVLVRVFTRLDKLKAIDFCGASSSEFSEHVAGFARLCAEVPSSINVSRNLSRLSLHHCAGLEPEVFEQLLPRLPHLTHLDLANTRVTWSGLSSLPDSCRLEELSLAQCTRLTGSHLIKFIAQHPGVSTLKNLNLLHSWNNTHPLAIEPWQLDVFLEILPPGLQRLDLGGMELTLAQARRLPQSLLEFGCHDIDLASVMTSSTHAEEPDSYCCCLANLEYLALSVNVISSEMSFASILAGLFPRLAVIESPGFRKLPEAMPRTFARVEGAGRRSWVRLTARSCDGVEGDGGNWHPRKLNLSLSKGAPRGLYNYYSYRVR